MRSGGTSSQDRDRERDKDPKFRDDASNIPPSPPQAPASAPAAGTDVPPGACAGVRGVLGAELISAFLSCAFAEGVNLNNDKGLKKVVEKAGRRRSSKYLRF